MGEIHDKMIISSSPSCYESESEELQRLEHAPPFLMNPKGKRLCKQRSMAERPRDMAWEKRRSQILHQEKRKTGIHDTDDLTDEDLNELKGCIELGFGFKEKEGQGLCPTIPALDLYFAVNRQYSSSPALTTESRGSMESLDGSSIESLGNRSSSFPCPKSDTQSWKICSPGEDPQQVKTKLRHWALAVACSVMQSH